MYQLVLKKKGLFAEGLDWCEEYLKPNSWRYNIEYRNGSPFDPTVIFYFNKSKDFTIFSLKFS